MTPHPSLLVTKGCQLVSPPRHRCCRKTGTTALPSRKTSIDMFRRTPLPRSARCTALRRHAVVVATVACGALVTTACSSGAAHPGVAQLSTTTTSTSSAPAKVAASLIAHADCMRSHGVPDFPDPGSIQIDVKTHPDLDPSSLPFVAAQKACLSLAPGGTSANFVSPALQTAALAYSACMRAHGFPNFADPVFDSRGEHVSINGIDTDSTQFRNADKLCQTSSGLAALSGASTGTSP